MGDSFRLEIAIASPSFATLFDSKCNRLACLPVIPAGTSEALIPIFLFLSSRGRSLAAPQAPAIIIIIIIVKSTIFVFMVTFAVMIITKYWHQSDIGIGIKWTYKDKVGDWGNPVVPPVCTSYYLIMLIASQGKPSIRRCRKAMDIFRSPPLGSTDT